MSQEPVGRRKATRSAPALTYELIPLQVDTRDLLWPKKIKLMAGKARWTRYTGVHRPCWVCINVIHELGANKAPLPDPATKRRECQGEIHEVCHRHAMHWQEADERAAREATAAEADQALREQAAATRRRVRDERRR